jgi:TPR repeat protein
LTKRSACTDTRAMVSLGLLFEAGDHVPKDIPGAYALYEKAAARGSADGAINLAVALLNGKGVEKDATRAEKLLRAAAQGGSAIATYNLGVLAEEGVAGKPADALDLFKQTSWRSARFPRGRDSLGRGTRRAQGFGRRGRAVVARRRGGRRRGDQSNDGKERVLEPRHGQGVAGPSPGGGILCRAD